MKKARKSSRKNPLWRALLPRRARERRRVELLGAGAATLLFALVFGVFVASSLHQLALRSSHIAAVVSAILVELANGERAVRGTEALTVNPVLEMAAQAKANDMAAKGYFAHDSPEGLTPWHWFRMVGYDYAYAGENLAVNFSDSGDVVRAWMASPLHRDNILNGRYTEIGIATAQGSYQGRPTTFVVQMFGSPLSLATLLAETAPPALLESGEEEAPPEAAAEEASADVAVLGSATPSAGAAEHVQAEPAAAVLAEHASNDIPAWGYMFGFPRDTLRYVYYALGVLVLLLLAFETGLEFHAHHRRKAIRAGLVLVSILVFFVIADYFFFAEPVLALGSVF